MSNGNIFPVKEAFSAYMVRWYGGLYADTNAIHEYASRGVEKSIIWVPGRMVDAAEEMLAAYRRNDNEGLPGHRSKLPVVMVGMAKDYAPTPGDRGRQTPGRQLIKIEDDEPGNPASIYGYRQAMGDVRAQVVIFAADEPSARSLATQFGLFIAEFDNRRFKAAFTWGQYTVQMPVTLETPDVAFMEIATDTKNLTILAVDLNLTATIPYFDAPRPGEQNDGTDRNPPGYPWVIEVNSVDEVAGISSTTTSGGVTHP